MNLTHTIRLLCESAFERQSKIPGIPPAPYMQPFLAVPLKERLTLLCLYDGQEMGAIKGALPWVKETDVRLSSHRIRDALAILYAALEDPLSWIDPGPFPDNEPADLSDTSSDHPVVPSSIPMNVETQLRQAFFPSTTLMLFGAHVPAAVAKISLLHRVIVYLVVVEELTWSEAMELLNCSKRQVHNSLVEMTEALGG